MNSFYHGAIGSTILKPIDTAAFFGKVAAGRIARHFTVAHTPGHAAFGLSQMGCGL
jgi:hypothetical protein